MREYKKHETSAACTIAAFVISGLRGLTADTQHDAFRYTLATSYARTVNDSLYASLFSSSVKLSEDITAIQTNFITFEE